MNFLKKLLGVGKRQSIAEQQPTQPVLRSSSAIPKPKVVAHEYDGTAPLKVGDIVHPDDYTLGRCVVERIQINPDGRGDIAFIRAEKAASPLDYESEPGDPTLYQFRSKLFEDQVKRAR